MVSWDGCIHKDAGVCFTVYPNMSVETLCKKKKNTCHSICDQYSCGITFRQHTQNDI